MTINNDDLQAMVEERAYACALKYREKLRRLHLSHTDYYLDTIPRLSDGGTDTQESVSRSITTTTTTTQTTAMKRSTDYFSREDCDSHIMSISVV